MYFKVTSYMYASAFLIAVCAGSNPQSFMVKFSKFSIMYMRKYAVFPQHWCESFSFCAAALSLTVKLLQIKKKTSCEVRISIYLFH